MLEIELYLDAQEKEVESFLSHIEAVSNQHGSISTVLILKSTFILFIYNIVESSTILLLELIHQKGSEVSYELLPDSMKILFADFYFDNQKPKTKVQHLNELINSEIRFPSFEEYVKRKKIFSGNLDDAKIRDVFSKYGIQSSKTRKKTLNPTSLQIVKAKRCQLAHGEIDFKDGCQNITNSELWHIKSEIFSLLRNLISSIQKYLSNKFP